MSSAALRDFLVAYGQLRRLQVPVVDSIDLAAGRARAAENNRKAENAAPSAASSRHLQLVQ